MPDSVSDLIFDIFFEKLAAKENINPETIVTLKQLYREGRLANKNSLTQMAEEMEARHAESQKHNTQ